MKNNVAISILAALLFISLAANYLLLEGFVEGSYASEFQPRYIEDTKVLSAVVDKEITAEELIQQVTGLDSEIEIHRLQDKKGQWDWNGPIYPNAVRAGNLTFFFGRDDRLARIDHWLAKNSPLFEN